MKSRNLVMVPCKKKLFIFFAIFCFLLFFIRIEAGAGGYLPEVFESDKSPWLGDPISAGNGAYYFTKPLLSLGGPMDLGFKLMYRSDYSRFLQWLTPTFWWYPFSHADIGIAFDTTQYATIRLPNSNQVPFKKNTSGEWVLTDPTENIAGFTLIDNVPQSKYKLKETEDFAYLMDPINGRVYIFKRLSAGSTYFRINRILDRNGNQIIYTYHTNKIQQPTKIEDGLGRSLTFTYESIGFWDYIKTITDQTGQRQVKLNYEAVGADNGNDVTLREVINAMNQKTTFQYADALTWFNNLIAREIRPWGNTPFTQAYDLRDFNNEFIPRVVSQTDAYRNTSNMIYTTPNDSITATRPDGSTEKYETYSSHGLLKSLTDPTNKTAQFTKDADEHITGVTDKMGDTTNFAYHTESGKLASLTNAKGNALNYTYAAQDQSFTNPLLPSEQVSFRFYNLTRIDYPDGTNEQFTYDSKGNMTQRTNQAGKVWNYEYNNRGQVTKITNPAGGTVEYTYNNDGTLASSRDSDTGTTTYAYDTYKRLTRITHPDNTFIQMNYNLNDQITFITDENNHTYTYEYNANSNLTKVTDPAGKQTQFAYDLMDRVTKITDRLSKDTNFAYDNMERFQSFTNPNNITATYGYDTRGWLNSITLGGKTWTTGYDDEGIVTSRKTPLNNTTTYQTDKLGFITGITNPLNQTTAFTRNSMSQITGFTDPLCRTTNYSYDSRGLLSSITTPVIGTATYQRNDLGLLSQITDLNNQNWAFGYTNIGRLSANTDPLGNTWNRTYDTRGRSSQTTYPDGSTLTRTYDDAGNLTRMLYSGGPDLQYTYNELDWLTGANGISFTRDNENRITATDNPGTVFGATYDDGGRLKTATYPSTGSGQAFTVTYTYDSTTGLLSRVTDNFTNTQIDFIYDNDRRMTGINRSNNVTTTLTWDNASRMTRIQDGPSTGSGFLDLQYTLDAAGQIIRANMTVPLDPASLLQSGTETFIYDAALQVSTSGYTYDKRGRLTASPGLTYNWDEASKLTGIGGTILAYNGLGDLVTRTESGKTNRYYYNYAIGLTPIVAEKDESTGQFLRYYIWTPNGRLLYMIDAANSNKVYFYHFDQTGSTLALTDSTGAVTDMYAYDPYGELLTHQGNNTQPFTFVGQWGVRQECPSTGSGCGTFYHMRARYYDAVTQRFISRDPIWPQITRSSELNPYQYVANEPLTAVDPTGKGGWIWVVRILNFLSGTPTGYAEGDPEWGRFGSPIGDDKELFELWQKGRAPINEAEAERLGREWNRRYMEESQETKRRQIREEDELKLMEAGMSPAEAKAFMDWLEQHFGGMRAQREFEFALEFAKHKGKRQSVKKVKGVWVQDWWRHKIFIPGKTRTQYMETLPLEANPGIVSEGWGPAEGF